MNRDAVDEDVDEHRLDRAHCCILAADGSS